MEPRGKEPPNVVVGGATLRRMRFRIVADHVDEPFIVLIRSRSLLFYVVRHGEEETDLLSLLAFRNSEQFLSRLSSRFQNFQKSRRQPNAIPTR